jgi:hypothetical protein
LREIEFAELRGDPAVEEGRVRLAGRVYEGPVQLGDTFTELTAADARREVTLRVDALLFYGKPVPDVHPGETAEIVLSGKGTELVTAGAVLRGSADETAREGT